MCHIEPLGPEMYVVVGRDVVEINCYPLGGVAKGQIVRTIQYVSLEVKRGNDFGLVWQTFLQKVVCKRGLDNSVRKERQ